MSESRVAVVVVNHNSAPHIYSALTSLRTCDPAVRVVVVDNASTDDSVQRIRAEIPEAQMILSERNLGFGGGVNLAAVQLQEEFLMLLNPDAEVTSDTITTLVSTLDDRPNAAGAGPLVLNPDGSVQPSKRAFPTLWQSIQHGLIGPFWPDNPGTRAYVLADVDMNHPTKVDWLSGSAVLFRKSAFDSVGGFDEDFFFFVEDVDLCKRLSDAGWQLWFEPRASVVHSWGGTWTKRPLKHLWMHQRNLFRYVTKHRRGAWVLAYPAIGAGLVFRFILLTLRWLVARKAVPAHRAAKEEKR